MMNNNRLIKVFAFSLSLTFAFFLAGCKNSPKQKEVTGLQPTMELDKRDTASVVEISDKFMTLLQNKEYDQAIDMLWFLKNGHKLVKLPEDIAKQQRVGLEMLPVLRYKLTSVIFYSEDDSQVRYDFEFFEREEGDTRPNTTSIFLKPVRRDGQWYLTLYDTQTHEGEESKIKN